MLDKLIEVGRYIKVDLHNLTKEEAKAEIFHQIYLADNVDSIVFVHGYHGGRVLKDLVRKEIKDNRISKVIPLDASTTAYRLKKYK